MNSNPGKKTSRLCAAFQQPILLVLTAITLFCLTDNQAVASSTNLVWAPNGTGPSDGSGSWLAGNNWWNGTAITSGNWLTATTPDIAIIGNGSSAPYTITLGNISSTLEFFTNSANYTLSGGTLTNFAAASGYSIILATNCTATINCPIVMKATQDWLVGTNSTLNINGIVSGGAVMNFDGGGAFNISTNIMPSQFWLRTGTLTQTGGTNALTSTAGNFFGYQGVTGPANYVENGGALTLNGTSASFDAVRISIGRAGKAASLTLSNGTVNVGTSGTTPDIIVCGEGGNGADNINVDGGVFTVGNSTATNGIYFGFGNGISMTATNTVAGGTENVNLICFGNAPSFGTTYTMGVFSVAVLNLNSGNLYIGQGGIIENPNGPGYVPNTIQINLNGGILGATASWSSSLPMNISTNLYFNAASLSGVSNNITLSGGLSDGTSPGGVIKIGGGTLTLSGNNTYSGPTVVANGALAISGASGADTSTSLFEISNNATLGILNTASANLNNRLNSAATITMDSGVFNFANDGSNASFNESDGNLIVNSGANTVNVSAATSGNSSTLTFNSLARIGGTLNFVGNGFGTAANTVLFTTPPTLGSWLTINGIAAQYNNTIGLYTASVGIAAQGATIVNGSGDVFITSAGTTGPDSLSAATTVVSSLTQDNGTASTVDTDSKTLRLSAITIDTNGTSLTIGINSGDGTLTTGASGGTLSLNNNQSLATNLTINAVIANNTSASSLTLSGSGTVILTASNTYSGVTTINSGTLALSGSGSISTTPSITMPDGTVLDVSGCSANVVLGNAQTLIGTAMVTSSLINCSGSAGLTLNTNASLQMTFNPVTPTFTVAGGSLTLNTSNNVIVSVSNGGTPLAIGLYVLISTNGTGAVAGNAPSTVTVNGDGVSGTPSLRIINSQLYLLVGNSTLTWDATGSGQDGPGIWNLTGLNWWNGVFDVAWPNGSSGIIGAGNGAAGTITLDNEINVGTLIFDAPGSGNYTLSGAGNLNVISGINVNGQAPTINCPITTPGGYTLTMGGGTLTTGGNWGTDDTGTNFLQVTATGSGTYLINGGVGTPSVLEFDTTTIQSGGAVSPQIYGFIGYPTAGSYTLNGGTYNQNCTNNSSFGGVAKLSIGRSATGTFTVAGGALNVGTIPSGSAVNCILLDEGSGTSTLDLQSGAITVGTGNAANALCFGGYVAGGIIHAANTIEGGTESVNGIIFGFGSTSPFNTNSTALLQLTGGSLYVGTSGIVTNTYAPPYQIVFSGGTVGAATDWSSPLAVTLTNLTGNVTVQAADSGNVSHNITLSGVLSGNGGMVKTGGGTLTLGGADTYTGNTIISNGLLAISTLCSDGNFTINDACNLTVTNATGATSVGANNVNLGNSAGGATLEFQQVASTTTPLITAAGTVTLLNGYFNNIKIDASAGIVSGHVYPLVKYGSLSTSSSNPNLSDVLNLNLPAGLTATLTNDTVNSWIALSVGGSTPPPPTPHFTGISLSGTTLTIQGTNGAYSGRYVLLGSTNLALPLNQWTPLLTNNFNSNGSFYLSTNIVNLAIKQQFYILSQ